MANAEFRTRLVPAILAGPFESPLWKTFLDLLRHATGADYATLSFRPPGMSLEDSVHLFSGDMPEAEVLQVYRDYVFRVEPRYQTTLVDSNPYSLDELMALNGASDTDLHRKLYDEILALKGVQAIRHMRVEEESGVDALLTIARHGVDFAEQDTALLRDIAPVLRGALRLYVALERERFAASMTAEAVRRLQFGWLTLDQAGQVLDCDEQGALVLSNSRVLRRSASGRLQATPMELEREIFLALDRVVESPQGRPSAITLRREPWLDMLLVPARRRSISARATPAVIAYVHGDSWRSEDRCEQLGELFALSPGEARLALALCRGMTMTEAAADFGLKVETVRGYSKTIYAKTGARGLPDLVRIVMRSVLAIAPDM